MARVFVVERGVTVVGVTGAPVSVIVGGTGNATRIRSRAITTAAPTDGQALVWDADLEQIVWAAGGGGASSFADLTGSIAAGQVPVGVVTQHQSALAIGWGQLTSVPLTFAPSAHTHPWSDLSGFVGSSLAQLATREYADLQGIPGTFEPSAHTHDANSGLTGTVLAATVVTSSLTTIGTLVAGAVPAALVTAGTFPAGAFVFQGAVSGITSLIATSQSVFGYTAIVPLGSPNTPGSTTNPTVSVLSTAPLSLGVGRWSTSASGGGGTVFARSKAAAIGSFAALASGDRLWTLAVAGDDGTDLATHAGYLRWEVDGAVTTNRVPGRLLIALAAGTADDDVSEKARFTITGLSLGTTTAPTAAGSLAAIGTGRFGPSVITAGVTLEANSATGTAVVVPTTFAIRSTSSAQDWVTTDWGNADWISNDSGLTSMPTRGRIGVNMITASGSQSSMRFYVSGSATTLDLSLTLTSALATFPAAVAVTTTLAMVSGQKLYLDGVAATGDTYTWESSANVLALVAGGATALSLTATSATFVGTIFAPASTTALASVVIPHGAGAPTGGALINGAFWTTTSALFGRINGTTLTYLGTAGIGGTGTFLRSTGTAGAWTTATIPATAVAGDLLYASATNVWTGLAVTFGANDSAGAGFRFVRVANA